MTHQLTMTKETFFRIFQPKSIIVGFIPKEELEKRTVDANRTKKRCLISKS